MPSGLDGRFIQFGIREEDISVIKGVCEKLDIDSEWVLGILKDYHEKRIRSEEVTDQEVEKIIKDALNELGA